MGQNKTAVFLMTAGFAKNSDLIIAQNGAKQKPGYSPSCCFKYMA